MRSILLLISTSALLLIATSPILGQSVDRANFYIDIGAEYNRTLVTESTLDGGGVGLAIQFRLQAYDLSRLEKVSHISYLTARRCQSIVGSTQIGYLKAPAYRRVLSQRD